MQQSAEIVSKSEFARLCGVTPARVTQWIAERKITGDALVGEGRSARIRVAIAKQQVNLRRDVGQALANGLETKLSAAQVAVRVHEEPGGADPIDPTSTDDIDRALKRQKLEAAERANRMAAAEEAATQGVYTETATVRAGYGTIAAQMIRVFEGAIPELATDIAGEFKLDARDLTLFITASFRKLREKAAEEAEAAARQIPETVEGAAT